MIVPVGAQIQRAGDIARCVTARTARGDTPLTSCEVRERSLFHVKKKTVESSYGVI